MKTFLHIQVYCQTDFPRWWNRFMLVAIFFSQVDNPANVSQGQTM